MRPLNRIIALAAVFGVVLLPAAASASAPPPAVYTKSYAGYSVTAPFKAAIFSTSVSLPSLSSLTGVTTGATAEIRLFDAYGENDFQVGGSPSGYYYHSEVSVPGGGGVGNCTPADFPSPDTISMTVRVFSPGYAYPNTVIDWNVSDSQGNESFCEFDFSKTVAFSKMQMVTAFNVKGFHAPASPVTAGAFSAVSADEATDVCCNTVFGTLMTFPHGKTVATSTGTSSGVKREVPSSLDPAGDAFTVTIP